MLFHKGADFSKIATNGDLSSAHDKSLATYSLRHPLSKTQDALGTYCAAKKVTPIMALECVCVCTTPKQRCAGIFAGAKMSLDAVRSTGSKTKKLFALL